MWGAVMLQEARHCLRPRRHGKRASGVLAALRKNFKHEQK